MDGATLPLAVRDANASVERPAAELWALVVASEYVTPSIVTAEPGLSVWVPIMKSPSELPMMVLPSTVILAGEDDNDDVSPSTIKAVPLRSSEYTVPDTVTPSPGFRT